MQTVLIMFAHSTEKHVVSSHQPSKAHGAAVQVMKRLCSHIHAPSGGLHTLYVLWP
jgi:hypothetical protein